MMFNNRIYGLTKGQYSPTSEPGKVTKSSPMGVVDRPFNPVALALGASATFVARTADVLPKHLGEILRAAAAHKGTAFIEIFQNCNIFNDKAFAQLTEKDVRDDAVVQLEHGKPLVFGKDRKKGIRAAGLKLEVIELGGQYSESDCLVWDEASEDPTLAFIASQMGPPHFPTPIGVLRAVERPAYEQRVAAQIRSETQRLGEGSLDKLLHSGDLWTVHEDGTVS